MPCADPITVWAEAGAPALLGDRVEDSLRMQRLPEVAPGSSGHQALGWALEAGLTAFRTPTAGLHLLSILGVRLRRSHKDAPSAAGGAAVGPVAPSLWAGGVRGS